ncbi:autophagy protein Apg9-domain-containing protein [Syncephalis pseudoplumigaleata]|uniref:Autophagy-related protein 9 n=1 Tax=Syncephalis pseudoplumigaleata TaxID=1712513 RepID=A0A4P9YS98_9FUNG|nr:autophagy protein Apg9-domain-containing protein [Syncephalis pseudoplumigaleata]|eukprot:RKP22634.1 autophagy protein Apg9-domain-containing protein [Syncephalis pseudoplumigaleata]
MNPIREDAAGHDDPGIAYNQRPLPTTEHRRLRFGKQPCERVTSHEEGAFFGRGIMGDRGGTRLGTGLRHWRSRVSSRERAIYEWTNVDNLDAFFRRVYNYYQGKGIYCILLYRLLNLLMLAFVTAFTTFLVGCVNYAKLHTSKSLSDALYDSCSSHMSGWLKFFVAAAWLYWSWKLVVFVYDVRKLVEMYNFYTFLLEIPDENYMIALINKDLLDLTVPAPLRYIPMLGAPLLTRTVEWNLHLCLINYAFDENGQVKKAFLRDSQRQVLAEG